MLDIITVKDFTSWYKSANPGQKLIYYSGLLCSVLDVSEFKHLKDVTWIYAVDGKIYLTQKRVGDGDYDYIATKASYRVPSLTPHDYYINNYYRRRAREKTFLEMKNG